MWGAHLNNFLKPQNQKTYFMMQILPSNTAYKLFGSSADHKYKNWNYQKTFLIDVLSNTQSLLDANIVFTDIKPQNILFNPSILKTTFIDLGGCLRFKNKAKIVNFDPSKHNIQFTKSYCSLELYHSGTKKIDLALAVRYSCGCIIDFIIYEIMIKK